MAKINGGIIGPNNPTGPFSAGGVWRLEDAFNAQKAGEWPVVLGYQIPNSLRFNSGSSDHLSRTPASAGNRKTWTWSCWIKRSAVGSNNCILNGGGNGFLLVLQSSNVLEIYNFSGSYQLQLITNQLFRDTSAWYHIVFVLDTTQATDTNRAKVYLNGSQITSFSTATYPSQNADLLLNNNNANYIGTYDASGQYFGGYMSEINFIDGQALTPSSFGETDATTGIWIPKAYTGSFGTNGFYLKFQDSSALGDDTSGNGNDFTVNNLTSIDQSYDSPTNNFATLSPLVLNSGTISQGNLRYTGAGVDPSDNSPSTIGVNSGKWYAEFKLVTADNLNGCGVCEEDDAYFSTSSNLNTVGYGYITDGAAFTNGVQTTSYGSTYTTGDIIGVALDMNNGFVYFSKNGTFQNSGVPTSGASGTGALTLADKSKAHFFIVGDSYFLATNVWEANFGYPPFTISSGNADANGFGNFEYAVPSGYYALCTKNLALYG